MYINARKHLGKDGFVNTWYSQIEHNLIPKEKPVKIKINDVVMIKADEKNRGKGKIGIIKNIYFHGYG